MKQIVALTGMLLLGAASGSAQAPGASGAHAAAVNITVSARMVTVDRATLDAIGLDYVLLGVDRVRLDRARDVRPSGGAAGVQIGAQTLGVTAFLQLLRERRALRSEATQQIAVVSGGEGRLASLDLHVDRFATRARGPSLFVAPTLLEDGSVHLRVSVRDEDVAIDRWGARGDGSPVDVATEIVVQPGVETLLASGSTAQRSVATGLLRVATADRERDLLVVVTVQPLSHR